MAGRKVVTYKRRRLLLRKDHAHVDLNFDAHPKVSVPKDLDKRNKRGKSIVENVVLNKDKEAKKCGEQSIAKNGENLPHGQKCVSQCNDPNSEKHQSMFETLCATAACTKQHDSLALNSLGNCIIRTEKTFPANSVVQQITLNANEEKPADVQPESLSAKWGLENEDKCKELVPMPPSSPPVAQSFMESDLELTKMSDGNSLSRPEGTSVLGAFALEETDNLNKGQCSDSREDLSQKRKLTSTLLTYKRNKRTKSIIGTGCAAKKCASDTPRGADCSVDPENKNAGLSKSFIHDEEKAQKSPEDTRLLAPATEPVVRIEDPPVGASTRALEEIPQDSRDMCLLKGKTRIDDDGKDMNTGSMPGSASEKRDSATPLDLSLTPRDIDCNRPLDDNFLTGPSEVHPDSVGLTNKGGENPPKKNISSVRAVTNKGKLVVDHPPVLAGTLPKHNYLQLFPENVSTQAPEMSGHLRPSSSLFRGVTAQPEVMANAHHGAYPVAPELPYLPAHHGQSFHDFLLPNADRAQSFPRHQMLLDNILTRARAARGGNQSSHSWSEEELDCLWIGVRRHGRGNWDAILGDRRLQFSPWKTTRDLAEKWQEEQSQIFSGESLPQARYACPPEVELSLGYAPLALYDPGALKRPPVHFMNIQPNRLPPQEMYRSAGTLGSYALPPGMVHPNWASDPSGIPSRPSDPAQGGRHPGVVWLSQQPSYGHAGMYFHPGLYNTSVPVQRRAEPQVGGGRQAPRCGRKRKANKQENPIVIPSDGSSEETISDDLTMKT